MNINFENIFQEVIPMEKFLLKWRFTDEKYDKLTDQHLEQLKPLNKEASKFLWDFITNTNLHKEAPFKKDFFKIIEKAKILITTKKKLKNGCSKKEFHLKNLFFSLGNLMKQ